MAKLIQLIHADAYGIRTEIHATRESAQDAMHRQYENEWRINGADGENSYIGALDATLRTENGEDTHHWQVNVIDLDNLPRQA